MKLWAEDERVSGPNVPATLMERVKCGVALTDGPAGATGILAGKMGALEGLDKWCTWWTIDFSAGFVAATGYRSGLDVAWLGKADSDGTKCPFGIGAGENFFLPTLGSITEFFWATDFIWGDGGELCGGLKGANGAKVDFSFIDLLFCGETTNCKRKRTSSQREYSWTLNITWSRDSGYYAFIESMYRKHYVWVTTGYYAFKGINIYLKNTPQTTKCFKIYRFSAAIWILVFNTFLTSCWTGEFFRSW